MGAGVETWRTKGREGWGQMSRGIEDSRGGQRALRHGLFHTQFNAPCSCSPCTLLISLPSCLVLNVFQSSLL